MIAFFICFVLTALAAVAAYKVGQRSINAIPVAPQPAPRSAPFHTAKQRCHTITFSYSDGSTKTFHKCQGHHEFTDAFGRSVAPKGATLISARGGVHKDV